MSIFLKPILKVVFDTLTLSTLFLFTRYLHLLFFLQMLWFESPTNPTLKIFDIEKIAKLAHDHGEIIVVHDNTFLTPYFQRPLELGVDISMYSLTKYLNGHSDVIMGAAVINDNDLEKRLRHIQNCKTH